VEANPRGTPQASAQARPSTTDDPQVLAIQILSNLLTANIDVGLKHCLTLGFHADTSLRTAFMHLLSNALQRGARFSGLAVRRGSTTPKGYVDLVTSTNLALAVAICDVCPNSELDNMVTLLFRLFEAKGALIGFVKVLVEREVAQTNHESELFRANSTTTRLLTVYARTYGYNYLRSTLLPLLVSLSEKPAECSFELDPTKASPKDDIERNAEDLKLMCQALLDLICSSINKVPIMFRVICHHIWEVVEERFPDSRHSAVGSFIFLRFFCPAIVAPESVDLHVDSNSREVRRALLLITKVIQNLANNVIFGNKEPHMKALNGFLSVNIRQVTKFLSDVAVRPRSLDVAASMKTFQQEAEVSSNLEDDDKMIHQFVSRHLSRLEADLGMMPQSFRSSSRNRPAKAELNGPAAVNQLRSLLEQSGVLADADKMSPATCAEGFDE
jgi:neurofibromin 1